MITYTKQNRLQKELMRLASIFRTDWKQVQRAKEAGYEPYNFGSTTKEKAGVVLIISAIAIPVILPAPIVVPLSYKFLLGGRK